MESLDRRLLKHAIKHFSKSLKKTATNKVKFPSAKKIRSDHTQHFAVIVEQAHKLISDQVISHVCGLEHWSEDRDYLINFFAEDLIQFITEEGITIPEMNSLVYGQNVIPEKALFNIARARLLPNTYETIDLANHAVAYQTYSIPFLIRLAIEKKLKSIIGFVKSDVLRYKETKRDTQEFPVTLLLKELKKIGCLDIPCSFEDLQEIYNWSCRFCHTGKKEYLWLNLKSIEVLSPLFAQEEHLKCQIEIQRLWGYGVLKPEITVEKLITYNGPAKPLYYLKKGWSIKKLERVLNSTSTKSLIPYTFYLSESVLDERSAFYCSKHETYI